MALSRNRKHHLNIKYVFILLSWNSPELSHHGSRIALQIHSWLYFVSVRSDFRGRLVLVLFVCVGFRGRVLLE